MLLDNNPEGYKLWQHNRKQSALCLTCMNINNMFLADHDTTGVTRATIALTAYRHNDIRLYQLVIESVAAQTIIDTVQKVFEVVEDLRIGGKARVFTEPRQICWYLYKKYNGSSYRQIQKAIGFSKDAATIQHGIGVAGNLIETDPDIKYKVEVIEQLIKAA